MPAETLEKSIFELENGQWKDQLFESLLNELLARKTPIVNHVIDFSGPYLPRRLRLNANVVAGDKGRRAQILLAIEDVTDADNSTQAQARMDRRKDEFFAMLAHELRNPLAPIANALNIVRRVVQDVRANPYIEMIGRQVNVMTRLLDDLLDMSRISRGLIKLEMAPLDLGQLVRGAVGSAKFYVKSRHHRIDAAVPDRAVMVKADAIRLEQVVGNLLNNAAKYTDPGGYITVTLKTVENDAVLTVQDTGIGIAPGVIPHIFELFMQANSAPGQSRGGLGIGLTLVKRLIELHGGTVIARSAGANQGSAFEVRLPLYQTIQPSAPSDALHEPGKCTVTPHRVLVVDDNTDSALSIVQLVKMWGHEPAHAFDGESALEVARNFKPDVALLDIGLPDIDGYTLAGSMRKLPGLDNIYLVAMTGYGQATDRNAALAAGFDVHMVKPIDLGMLENLLSGAVERKPNES